MSLKAESPLKSWGLPHPVQIVAVVLENDRTLTFVLDARLPAQPGQFVMVWLPRLDEKPFSLVDDDPVTLTVARVGPFTEALHRLRPGDPLWLRGPFGHGFEVTGRRVLLVGGGYGVAPLAFLARRLRAASRQVMVVIGARRVADVIPAGQFEALGIDVVVTTEDGSLGRHGLATDAAEDLLATGEVDQVYACGPNAMLEALKVLCQRRRVPAQLSWEAFMRCGMGLCGSCERDGWLTCLDGPVEGIR
jgi:dihydroorotate dehydrogenase electron transfer subunit